MNFNHILIVTLVMTPYLSATSHPVKRQNLAEDSAYASNFVGKNVTKSSVENNIIQKKIRKHQKEGRKFTVQKYSDALSTKAESIEVEEELDPSPANRIRLHTDTSSKNLSDSSALLYRSKEVHSSLNYTYYLNDQEAFSAVTLSAVTLNERDFHSRESL